jgi:EpsI family protein
MSGAGTLPGVGADGTPAVPLSGGEEPSSLALGRREMLLGGLMLAGAGTALWATPRRYQSMLGRAKVEDLVPKSFDGWRMDSTSGLVLPPADQLSDQVYKDMVTRTYVRPGSPPVMLLVAYGGSQGGVIQVHRPEVCYPAGGYRLTRLEPHVTEVARGVDLPSTYILAESDTRTEQIVYWTRMGSLFPRTWREQRVAVLRENLAGIIPDGVLVRLSTLAPGPVEGLLDGFAAALYRAGGPRLRGVMAGER